jgi:hypothetical protein
MRAGPVTNESDLRDTAHEQRSPAQPAPRATPATSVRLQDAFAHSPYPYAQGEKCRVCKDPATHKIGEYTTQQRHEFTAYLCCEHFGAIMGRVARHWCAGEWPAQP